MGSGIAEPCRAAFLTTEELSYEATRRFAPAPPFNDVVQAYDLPCPNVLLQEGLPFDAGSLAALRTAQRLPIGVHDSSLCCMAMPLSEWGQVVEPPQTCSISKLFKVNVNL
eukprot:726847-Rhodomonas_salina.1